MQKYAATLSYLGTHYCGWQKQSGAEGGEGHGASVQATVENTLRKITQEPELSVVGSGRTDSGVHATGQTIHFLLKLKVWSPTILMNALNGLLPPSIRVLEVQPVSFEFHAQRSALRKQYSYFFQQGPAPLPQCMATSWWIRKRLDLAAMRAGLAHLVGEHDFKPFQAAGAKPMKSTVRRILEAEIEQIAIPGPMLPHGVGEQFELVRMRVVGTGFLKQMVRGIAGTLLQVGEQRRDAACFAEILRTKDRNLVGPTAPARALWLEQVWYPENLFISGRASHTPMT